MNYLICLLKCKLIKPEYVFGMPYLNPANCFSLFFNWFTFIKTPASSAPPPPISRHFLQREWEWECHQLGLYMHVCLRQPQISPRLTVMAGRKDKTMNKPLLPLAIRPFLIHHLLVSIGIESPIILKTK